MITGGEGDENVTAVVFVTTTGAGETDAGALCQARTLVWQQRRIGGQANDYRTHARVRQRSLKERGVSLFHIASHRIAVDAQFVTDAVVRLDNGANSPTALSATQAPRCSADTALEFVADHAAATTDRALDNGPNYSITQGFGHMLVLHMKTVDVVEQPVIGLQHHRHVPVDTAVIRLLFTVQHNQCIAHHTQAVGVGEGDGTGQKTRFANPLQTGCVAVAVQHMDAGKARLLAGGTDTRLDDCYPSQDVAAVGGASSHIAVTDPNARHIGDGVEGTGLQLAELNIQVTGTWLHRVFHDLSLLFWFVS
ncbi:hypothetical protein D3C80_689270 [compost metagenome]